MSIRHTMTGEYQPGLKDNKYSELNTRRKRKRSIRGYILQQRLNFRFFITGTFRKEQANRRLSDTSPWQFNLYIMYGCFVRIFKIGKNARRAAILWMN